jgi:predicted nuclease of restriction endonuclease-like (RecB) superfamily
MTEKQLTSETLADSIQLVHGEMAAQASKAVNISLTLRNWIIGCYISEYELRGADRAEYGKRLFSSLANALKSAGIKDVGKRQLHNFHLFYKTYPQIVQTASAQLQHLLPEQIENVQTVSAQLQVPVKTLLNRLSYSHLAELFQIDDPLKRTYYEVECIKGCWSVRELKRQIASLYYERSGLSKNKEKLAEMVRSGAEAAEPKLAIRDPYIFEFLGLKPKEVMGESDLEDGLLDKLQDFLLELGHGFCFEDRQKRILIGDTYGFIDLVFYHRILKCHVLIDLKLEKFSQENIGQLNTYVSWYKQNMMVEGDNPPIGLLLCTQKDNPLVEYALAGMDNHLFVSKYQLELPQTEQLQTFLQEQIKKLDGNK